MLLQIQQIRHQNEEGIPQKHKIIYITKQKDNSNYLSRSNRRTKFVYKVQLVVECIRSSLSSSNTTVSEFCRCVT